MTTGTWTLALLLSAVGALPQDVFPYNETNIAIPVRIDPAQRSKVRELQLFVSRDEGVTWEQQGVTTPDSPSFPFVAQKNGLYWFQVIVVDMAGKKDPPAPDASTVSQKILVDTLKPDLRASADRLGEEVVVKWEVREEYPDLGTLKLEYRATDGAAGWQSVPVNPLGVGQVSFRPGVASDLQIRMQVGDLAKNVASSEARVAGLPGAMTTVSRPSTPPPPPPIGALPLPPAPGPLPVPAAPGPVAPPPGGDRSWNPVGTGTAPAPMPLETPRPLEPARGTVSPVQNVPVPGGVSRTTIASSAAERAPEENLVSSGPGVPARSTSPQLPTLQVINTLKVPIEYQVSQFGPSGVKIVDVYLTQDDGRTWVLYGSTESTDPGPVPDAKPDPITLTRTLAVELQKEGLYGFYLLPKSGAGLSKAPPQPGTLPQIRVEVDLTPPTAEMYRPEADPAKRDSLVLSWIAQDRNLTARPIKLEWADRKDGHWEVVGETELANTGRFTWQVPKGLPPKVFLRLTVRDSGGNVSVAETPEPILVDLNEPIIKDVRISVQR